VGVSSLATALYVRVSTADQRADFQTEELQAFCCSRGYATDRLFVERESGAKVTCPQLAAMMAEVRSGRVARVVVYKLVQLVRSLTHLALILDELQRLDSTASSVAKVLKEVQATKKDTSNLTSLPG
jgi:DNA invertase Pin-like site-specific DNA recombinase